MLRVIHDEDFRCDIGKAGGGGTFVRVVHEPSGLNRYVAGLTLRTAEDVTRELFMSLVAELEKQGWCRKE